MASLPSLRATGQKVWSRIRRQDHERSAAADAKLRALRLEVERVGLARSRRERAAQLARVLTAANELAAAHGVSPAELDALRAGRTGAVAGIKRQLRQRATGVVTQMWNVGVPLAARGQRALGLTPSAIASTLIKRELQRAPRAFGMVTRQRWVRSPFVLRVGRPGPSRAREPQLIAASLLHLPRLQRQMLALGRSLGSAKLVRLPASPIGREHVAAANDLLRSGRSGLQLKYEVASAGAQLFLRSYLLPRVLRYLSAGLSTGVALREVVTARVLPPSR
ncbi:MAG TPA: hypothetical protein VFN67_17070 [Polyangiales bacterium]|nr:hypothetical protein [Polyangiales bacterium]